ncbi:hypothetical protein HNQ37_000308 [Lactovum miscens]|uniref:Uncharacterized protein n=1 Tax=Lactovum miscens TaxID=190387 RepID=A0A841C6R7_9LACT|nr:hypothetical protein [Lactovum miscens]
MRVADIIQEIQNLPESNKRRVMNHFKIMLTSPQS